MDFFQISENDYIFDTNAALLFSTVLMHRTRGDGVVLIDSGCGPCPELFEALDRMKLHVEAAICTHLHWDHTANNEEILKRGGRIFASIDEKAPYATGAPQMLNGVEWLVSSYVRIAHENYLLIPTPGHCPGHIAVVTPDDNCHVGDALMGPQEIAMAKLPFMENTALSIKSLETLAETRHRGYVIAHSGYHEPSELMELIEINNQKEQDLYTTLFECVTEPTDMDEMAVKFMRRLGIGRSAVLNHSGWRMSVKRRMQELADAELVIIEGNIVRPML